MVSKIINFPTGMTALDLAFERQVEEMTGDYVWIGKGTLTSGDIASLSSVVEWDAALADNFNLWGELAEKPGNVSSKVNRLRTRNFVIAGRRSTTVSIKLCGLSNLQKQYLESTAFNETTITAVLRTREKDRVILFNGLRWTCDWSGEVDGLFSVELSSEFVGATRSKVLVFKSIPALPQSPGPASNVSVTLLSDSGFTVGWTAGSDADTYTLEVHANSSFTDLVGSHTGITDLTDAITGLSDNTPYWVRVRSINVSGESAWASPASQPRTEPSHTAFTWIATDGNDGTGDGTYANPYATIAATTNLTLTGDKAIIYLKDGVYTTSTATYGHRVNKAYTLRKNPATGGTVVLQSSSDTVMALTPDANAMITLEGLTIDQQGTSTKGINMYGANAKQVTITNCSLINGKTIQLAAKGTVNVSGCSFQSTESLTNGAIQIANPALQCDLTVTDTSFNCNAPYAIYNLNLNNYLSNVTMTGCEITLPTASSSLAKHRAREGAFKVKDSTITLAANIQNLVYNSDVSDHSTSSIEFDNVNVVCGSYTMTNGFRIYKATSGVSTQSLTIKNSTFGATGAGVSGVLVATADFGNAASDTLNIDINNNDLYLSNTLSKIYHNGEHHVTNNYIELTGNAPSIIETNYTGTAEITCDIEFNDNEIDCKTYYIAGYTSPSRGGAILLFNTDAASVINSEIARNTFTCLKTNPLWGFATINNNINCDINHNVIDMRNVDTYAVLGYSIKVINVNTTAAAAESIKADYNTIYFGGNSGGCIFLGTDETTETDSNCDSVSVTGNLVYGHRAWVNDNSRDVSVVGPCHAIFVGYYDLVAIMHNSVYGSGYGIIYEHNNVTTVNAASAVQYNVIIDCQSGISAHGITTARVLNNTIINRIALSGFNVITTGWNSQGIAWEEGVSTPLGCLIKDNVIYVASANNYHVFDTKTHSVLNSGDIDYNTVFSNQAATQFARHNGTPYTLAAWQAAGQDTNSQIAIATLIAFLLADVADMKDINPRPQTSGSSNVIEKGVPAGLGANFKTGMDASNEDIPPMLGVEGETSEQSAVSAWNNGAYI